MINEIDRIGSLEYARQEGHAEGLTEGIKKGHEEVATAMKKQGLPIECIVACTGLSPERIAEL